MVFIDDTIVAISTPVGQGGIGIVRLSGPDAIRIGQKIFVPKNRDKLSGARSHSMLLGNIINTSDGGIIDEVLVSVMCSPNSYTKEDVVEINCHGGMISVKRILELAIENGARLAEPGEFTKRAFLNGRIKLTQAEAVLDLIRATTEESLKIAMLQLKGDLSEKLDRIRNVLIDILATTEAHMDFPDDEIEPGTCEKITGQLNGIQREIDLLSGTFQAARLFREGLSTAIVGRPNVGKSSLLNALLKKDRAIVTEIPGTTRDVIEDLININGLPVRIIDTAGIRNSDEVIEREGIRRSLDVLENSDFIIAMFDGSEALQKDDFDLLDMISAKSAVIAVNKSDLPLKIPLDIIKGSGKQYLRMSVSSGGGLEELKSVIFNTNLKNWKEEREGTLVTNIRHKMSLDRSSSSLSRAVKILSGGEPLEIFSIELRDALDNIGEITGAVTREDILDKIFSDFCIGK